ncbi:site-specific tyrosine recombinase/integron integrase, partial [Carboxylicivirga linearis]
IGKLDYVHYSHQYKCYYIRNKTEYKQKLFQDLKQVVQISTRYLKPETTNSKQNHLKNYGDDEPTVNQPLVSIILMYDKGYLKLPVPYKQEWSRFLRELGCFFESRRQFWIVPNYLSRKESIQNYFKQQGCYLQVSVKHDEKVQSHLKRQYYKDDKEIQDFIKVMTLQGASKRTIENYGSQLKKLKNYYGGKTIKEISDEEIRDYLFFIRQELNYSPSAQNIAVSAVKRFILSMTDRDFNSNHIPRPSKVKGLPKVLEKKEIEALLRLNIYIKHRCLLYLLYATGIRCGELVNLKVEDVNFDDNIIVINQGKGNKSRIVSLSEKLKDLLIQYLRMDRPNFYFFEGQNGGKYSTSSVQRVIKRAALKAGLEKRVTPHMLRHSFATHLHDSGMDIRNIQKLLGHTSTKTTEIYTYISKRDISKLKSPLDDLDV